MYRSTCINNSPNRMLMKMPPKRVIIFLDSVNRAKPPLKLGAMTATKCPEIKTKVLYINYRTRLVHISLIIWLQNLSLYHITRNYVRPTWCLCLRGSSFSCFGWYDDSYAFIQIGPLTKSDGVGCDRHYVCHVYHEARHHRIETCVNI